MTHIERFADGSFCEHTVMSGGWQEDYYYPPEEDGSIERLGKIGKDDDDPNVYAEDFDNSAYAQSFQAWSVLQARIVKYKAVR